MTRFVPSRSALDTHPQNGPNRWKISSPKPRWVTVPIRSPMFWTKTAAANVTTMNGRKKPAPYIAPDAA